jgi:hypothetical protein
VKSNPAEIANKYGSDSPEYARAVIRLSCRRTLLRSLALAFGFTVVVIAFLLLRLAICR